MENTVVIERIIKENSIRKDKFRQQYVKCATKEEKSELYCACSWRLEKENGTWFLLRGITKLHVDNIGVLTRLFENHPYWYIVNISNISKLPVTCYNYIITETEFQRIKAILARYMEINKFCILKVDDLEKYKVKNILTGTYKILFDNKYFILVSKDKDLLLLSDSNLKITLQTNFKFKELMIKHYIIRNLDISDLTSVREFFSRNFITEKIEFYNFDTRNVTDFSKMFFSCPELKSITLENLDTVAAISMNNMFKGCKELEYLDISTFKFKNVKCMESMFKDCEKIKTTGFEHCNVVELLNNKEYILDCSHMFENCKKLKGFTVDFLEYFVNNLYNTYCMFTGTPYEKSFVRLTENNRA